MNLRLRRKQLLSIMLSASLLFAQIPPVLAAPPLLGASSSVLYGESSVTVTTPKQFMEALENGIPHIIVSGLITIGAEADASGRMLPAKIPAGTIIEGRVGSILNCRCPIQLEGDNVTIKNLELLFESSNALGSVPHREIFLAGHSLTLDNVSTYLDGGDGSFGPLGGTEKELLPSVLAGGFPGASVGSNASLTIINSNSKTMFQDIYMGHGSGKDQNVSYTGDAVLKLDNPVTVRGSIYTDSNTSAEIYLNGNGKSIFNHAYATSFVGNDTTTLRMTDCTVSRAVIDGVGMVQLNNATLMPQTDRFHTVNVQENACLDLSELVNVTITGDFVGDLGTDIGTAGKLVLDREGSITIQGTVEGTTIFQTGNRSIPGAPIVGKEYIIAGRETDSENFVIPEKYVEDGYKIQYMSGAWSIYKDYAEVENIEIGGVEISQVPAAIDLAKIITGDPDAIPDPSIYCKILWKDTEGNTINFQDALDNVFEASNVLRIKTEYLSGDSSHDDELDWGNSVSFRCSEQEPNRYYFTADAESKTGEYTFRFYSVVTDDYIKESSTITDVKNLDRFKIGEFQVYFYNSSEAGGSVTNINDDASVQTIADQAYTGYAICPSVKVISNSSGNTLTLNQDYCVSYENNVDVGTATAKIIGIGNYSGEITAQYKIVKNESDVYLTAAMGTGNVDVVQAVYGDTIRFVCKAVPEGAQLARMALPDTVDFYCGKELLGTAPVNSNGQAILIYRTEDRKIPIGTSEVFAEFGGTDVLNPSQSLSSVSVTLEKQKIQADDIKSVVLKDFTYDGTRNTTDIISLTTGEHTFFLTGKAELVSAEAGTYTNAKILSWSLNEEDSKWYQLPNVLNSILVNPSVTIIPAKAPEQIAVSVFAKPQTEQSFSISDVIPAELSSKVLDYQLGKTQFDNTVISNLGISDGVLTYQAEQAGTETMPILVTLENYFPLTVMVTIIVTDKENIPLNLTSPDRVYNGKPYGEWSTSLEDGISYTVSYYDLVEQQELVEAPKDAGSYSVTVYVENESFIGEETSNFEITPKEVHICALNKSIPVGGEVPDLSNPQLLVDYTFEEAYEPIDGEDLGAVQMAYQETPDNTKEGSYKILIRLLDKTHPNYTIIEKEGTLSITASGEHIHNYVTVITKEPTCTENGIKTYTCSECGDSYTEEISTVEHTIASIPAIESTCTEEGKTEGKYCSVCNTILEEQISTPKKAHSYGAWIIDIAATSTREGKKHRVCSLCNDVETVTIPKLENGNNKPGGSQPDDSDQDSNNGYTEDDSEDRTQNNSFTNVNEPSDNTDKTNYKDPVKGYINMFNGIVTGNGNDYSEWKQSDGKWWLEYADGTWPCGQLAENGEQIYKWEKINGAWYAFNTDGYAEHGWHLDAGYQGWFYIDINSGMKTGWQLIDGRWYYFNSISDGMLGRMYAGCYTPDGWYVDESGAWDENSPQHK